jgi:eukaryotic-like serine/threonine-protein kinase
MAMPNAPRSADSAPKATKPKVTLRALLDGRRAEGRTMSVEEAIAVIVPVCLELQTRHGRGERLLVHPSSIAAGIDGVPRLEAEAAFPPAHPFDRHCLAPELQRTLEPGDACASVYSVGAILYEMVTGHHIGPAMKRPRELDPDLPEALEILIGKAIIGDRAHRPGDLGALASAMYHVAPQKSVHPPEISEARLDASAELEVDVRFSMLPPSEVVYRSRVPTVVAAFPQPAPLPALGGGDPFGAPVIERTSARQESGARISGDDPTSRLSALKNRLESDPRSRYVVNKQRMDHGPFTAVELLQQIASGAFASEDVLRDSIGGEQMPIAEWEEFAPFAEQSLLVQEKRAEQTAVVRAADADKKRGIAKTIVAVSFVLALAGVLAVWFFTRRGTRDDSVVVSNDRTGTIEVNGDIKGKKGKQGGPGHGVGGVGYSGGQSYEAVLNSNNETVTMGEQGGSPDLNNAQLAAPLRSASFVPGCGAPDDMKVTVRVAVRMGVPIGVTVNTQPASSGVAACIDRAVRGLRWPASAKTDFVTTSY